MKARVIVTLNCNRNCENCCNKEEVFDQHERLFLPDIFSYDEILITGGEPMLIPERVINFITFLKGQGYKGKIYLYSALYNKNLQSYYDKILSLVDGFQFTVHYEATDKEIIELRQLSEDAPLSRNRHKSNRLAIDSRLYNKYDFSNINFSNWSLIRKMEWLENCPLPSEEKLFIYEL